MDGMIRKEVDQDVKNIFIINFYQKIYKMAKYQGKTLIEILQMIQRMKDYNSKQLSELTGLENTFLRRLMNGYTDYKPSSLQPFADFLSTKSLLIDLTIVEGLNSVNTKIRKQSNNLIQAALIRVFWKKM